MNGSLLTKSSKTQPKISYYFKEKRVHPINETEAGVIDLTEPDYDVDSKKENMPPKKRAKHSVQKANLNHGDFKIVKLMK